MWKTSKSFSALLAAWLAPFAVISLTAVRPDPDAFWHLATGRWILQHLQIPYADPFALSNPRHWIDHEWGTETLFGFFNGISYAWVLAFVLIIATTIATLQIRHLYLRGQKWSDALVIGLITIVITGEFFTVRPQIMTYLFSLLLVLIFEKGIVKKDWGFLGILFVLWANLHGGGTAVAYLIIGGYTVDAIVRGQWKDVKQYLLTGILAIIGFSVNPYGPRMILYPFQIMLHPDATTYISEWQSPNFHGQWNVLIYLLLLGLTLFLSRQQLSFRQVAFIVGFTAMALYSRRHEPFLFILAPVFLANIKNPFVLPDTYRPKIPRIGQHSLGALFLLASLIIAGHRVYDWPHSAQGGGYEPKGAYAYLEQTHYTGPINNPYAWGGSLIYHFGGIIQPSMDGRTDLYTAIYNSTDLYKDYSDTFNIAELDPDSYLKKYPSALVLVFRHSWFYFYLEKHPSYKLVYSDDDAAIFKKVN